MAYFPALHLPLTPIAKIPVVYAQSKTECLKVKSQRMDAVLYIGSKIKPQQQLYWYPKQILANNKITQNVHLAPSSFCPLCPFTHFHFSSGSKSWSKPQAAKVGERKERSKEERRVLGMLQAITTTSTKRKRGGERGKVRRRQEKRRERNGWSDKEEDS